MPRDPKRATLDAYQADPERCASGQDPVLPDAVLAEPDEFAALLAPGARVLEIGSGPGSRVERATHVQGRHEPWLDPVAVRA